MHVLVLNYHRGESKHGVSSFGAEFLDSIAITRQLSVPFFRERAMMSSLE